MDETKVAKSILDIVSARLAQTPNCDSVLSVNVLVGEFRNVDLESLQFAFESLRKFYDGCQSCNLTAELIKSRAVCREQGHTFSPESERQYVCPQCGGSIGKLLCGEELDVVGTTLRAI